jgi:hypothetical protein
VLAPTACLGHYTSRITCDGFDREASCCTVKAGDVRFRFIHNDLIRPGVAASSLAGSSRYVDLVRARSRELPTRQRSAEASQREARRVAAETSTKTPCATNLTDSLILLELNLIPARPAIGSPTNNTDDPYGLRHVQAAARQVFSKSGGQSFGVDYAATLVRKRSYLHVGIS